MIYSVNEVASLLGLSAHTLRFYDQEGLMPFIGKDDSGNLVFTETDLNWVAMVCCLKDTGMSIKEIKQYADWCMEGAQTVNERKTMLSNHRISVLQRIEELKKNLDLIDWKISIYDNPELFRKMYGVPEKTKERTRLTQA